MTVNSSSMTSFEVSEFNIDNSLVEGEQPILTENLFKKQYGVFYTPSKVAKILCNWAVKSSDDTILEPSFGGCGFLVACKSKLEELSCHKSKDQIFGCDIDKQAFVHLETMFGCAVGNNFIFDDFLSTTTDTFGVDGFNVIIGNPPYVSHHNMSPNQKKSIQALGKRYGFTYDKSSLWVYFVRHGLHFLKPGGRMAWVLPGSFLYADYSAKIKDLLKNYFSQNLVICLEQRLFLDEGADEQTVVVLSDGFGGNKSSLKFAYVKDLCEMEHVIHEWEAGNWQGENLQDRPNATCLSSSTAFSKLASSDTAKVLGDFCTLKIGIVTGANRFFIINDQQADNLELQEFVSFALARFSDVQGLDLTLARTQNIRQSAKRCLLVDTTLNEAIEGSLLQYLETFPNNDRESNSTFKKRGMSAWHRPNDKQIPDAFFPYMHKDGPALLLNSAKVTCTNTVHRVFFKEGVTAQVQRMIAISILSSFSQLSAEIEGRIYGSGVLKHEPSEALRIQLIMPQGQSEFQIDQAFRCIDNLTQRGAIREAQDIADEFVLHNYSEHDRQRYIADLRLLLADIRGRRQKPTRRH